MNTIINIIEQLKWSLLKLKNNTYIDSIKEVDDKDPKFKVGDRVRISKYKNIFAKGYTPNWPEEVFVIKEVKNAVPWTYIINDFNGEESIGTFYEKELKKQISKYLGWKKLLKEKEINCMSSGKDMIIHLIAGLIKMILYSNGSILS